MKQIVVDRRANQTRIALLEGGKLVELSVETAEPDRIGNVYRGRVTDVLPGMQAAFVDIGFEKNAYLYIDDIEPLDRRSAASGGSRQGIRQLVQRGAERLVQVVKEGIGDKGPRITTRISIPGRYLVYLPDGREVTVSRRIEDGAERTRLVQLVSGLKTAEEGVILRTAAAAVSEAQLSAELAALRAAWKQALERTREVKSPCLVFQAADMVLRTVRDLLTPEVDELLVEDGAAYRRIKEEVSSYAPELVNRVTLYRGKQPLFEALGIERELDKTLKRQIWLKSGGFIVIDRTEAMTVIDVNTGKFTGKSSQQLEETVTATNLEAAVEIARQIRLRDLGGMILIDFIDMQSESNRAQVLKKLQAEVAKDRTSTYVYGITRLGLVEMTRKKVRQSLSEALTMPCPACGGNGRILSTAELARRLETELTGLVKNQGAEAVIAELPASLHERYTENGGREWRRLEQELSCTLYLHKAEWMRPDQYHIRYAGTEAEADRNNLSTSP